MAHKSVTLRRTRTEQKHFLKSDGLFYCHENTLVLSRLASATPLTTLRTIFFVCCPSRHIFLTKLTYQSVVIMFNQKLHE